MNGVQSSESPAEQLALWAGETGVPGASAGMPEALAMPLRRLVGAAVYERWFSQAAVEWPENGKVVMRVPSLMHRYWITDNYMSELGAAAAEAFGGAQEIEFREVVEPMPHLQPLREAARAPERTMDHKQIAELAHGPVVVNDQKLARTLATSGINSLYSFDTFVVGPNCAYSVAVSKAVAEKPGKTYNPLFLHGCVGLGKTHLLHAIGLQIIKEKPRKVVRYLTSETFTNEYIDALRHGRISAFRNNYRKVDVLLIDDIEFLRGKDGTQEEFFHTFNDLFNLGKQIVMTCDSAPSEIKNMEARLVSRFEWGMATRIDSPTVETRTAILRQKMVDWKVQVADWIIQFIAENIHTNIRRLEGALMRVAANESLVGNAHLSRESLESMLKDLIDVTGTQAITIDGIQRIVAEHFDVRLADMTSRRRPAAIALPRQIAMYLSRELTKNSLKEIGGAFGGKDHGTVIHACKVVSARMDTDEEMRRAINTLTDKIRRGSSSS